MLLFLVNNSSQPLSAKIQGIFLLDFDDSGDDILTKSLFDDFDFEIIVQNEKISDDDESSILIKS